MKTIDQITILFSGDSGDGMQLTGTQCSNTSAQMGNDIATFPDYPSEIRAPTGTIFGVSGFQLQIGAKEIFTPGDQPDVLVAMNPAALKAKLPSLKKGGTVIMDDDGFTSASLKKAGYRVRTYTEIEGLEQFKVIHAKISSQTAEVLKESPLDNKQKRRCKNFYALGLCYFLFTRDLEPTLAWLEQKFAHQPELAEANRLVLKAGYHFGETIEAIVHTYQIPPVSVQPGTYRQIDGNTGVAWGLIQAAKAAGLDLFLGSYPITPATSILQELAKRQAFGVKTFQAEDEIAAICAAIGASFGGALAATTTSGPGLALKAEALNLAVMLELPLVVVDVQRAGPSTGLPTKTEQADLLQVMFGRNGESPLIVLAVAQPSDAFEMAFEAARLSLEHMTPVVLLSDGYLANGSEPWLLPDLTKTFNHIKTKRLPGAAPADFKAYERDEKLVRPWAVVGDPGGEHRLGGLEKDYFSGNVSHHPENHQLMVELRAEKVANVRQNIPLIKVNGPESGPLLIVSWGSTFGAVHSAVEELQLAGHPISHVHLRYINPFPQNLATLLKSYDRILVPELNYGQLLLLLNAKFQCGAIGYHKIKGQPFRIDELKSLFLNHLNRTDHA